MSQQLMFKESNPYKPEPLNNLIYKELSLVDSKIANLWQIREPTLFACSDHEVLLSVNYHLKTMFSKLLVDIGPIERYLIDMHLIEEWLCMFRRYVVPFMIKHYR